MIRTKAYVIREISHLKKKKKKLEIELLTLSKAGAEMFGLTQSILEKELIEIGGIIKGYQFIAFTDEKSLPKIKTKKKNDKVSTSN